MQGSSTNASAAAEEPDVDEPVTLSSVAKNDTGMFSSRNQFILVQRVLLRIRWLIYTKVWGMDIHPTAHISLKANLDYTHPGGVHIGKDASVAFGAVVMTHDAARKLRTDTYIGERTMIGGNSIILPGVRVGDGCIVGAGSVVVRDVPDGCVVVGNPAEVVKEGIKTGRLGILAD